MPRVIAPLARMLDDVYERLLVVVGNSTDPDRLRYFDESYRLDLQRAADEYGPAVNDD